MATRETACLTADVVLIAEGRVLLIERRKPPYAGLWALPGGHVDAGEEIEAAARRELVEETGIAVGAVRLVEVYAAPGRDPRGRYATWAYLATLPEQSEPRAADDAADARWWPLGSLPELAFDHARIVADALAATKSEGGR